MAAKRLPFPVKLWLAAEALVALAQARLTLHRTAPDDVLARNREAERAGEDHKVALAEDDIGSASARVAWAIRQIAPRVPWRSDCLVQALAGQRMLRRRGIASAIAVGTAKNDSGALEAHAWLVRGESVILGGDISRYAPLLQPRTGSSGEE